MREEKGFVDLNRFNLAFCLHFPADAFNAEFVMEKVRLFLLLW